MPPLEVSEGMQLVRYEEIGMRVQQRTDQRVTAARIADEEQEALELHGRGPIRPQQRRIASDQSIDAPVRRQRFSDQLHMANGSAVAQQSCFWSPLPEIPECADPDADQCPDIGDFACAPVEDVAAEIDQIEA